MSKQRNSRIPNTLEECTNTGTTVSNLYNYAIQLEKWGKRLFVILIVVGIIFTVVETVSLIDVNEELIIPTLISCLLSWSIYAVIEFFAYHILAMLIRALASITANTMITANVALWEASKKENTVSEVVSAQRNNTSTQESDPKTNPTKHDKENTVSEVVSTQRNNASTQKSDQKTNPTKHDDGSWTCPSCGQRNLSTRTSCWRCDCQI